MASLRQWWRLIVAALLSRSNRAFYDRIAPVYDDIFTGHRLHAERMVGLLCTSPAGREGAMRVLDLGCGTGLLTQMLSDKGFAVTGIDISLASLKRMQQSTAAVYAIQADGAQLPLRDGAFDAVVSLGAWRHFPAPPQVMAEIVRTLRPDGQLIVGYFPPALGGLVHSGQGVWGRLLAYLYQWFIRWRGYADRADRSLQPETETLARHHFLEVNTPSSGEHWHLIVARRPRPGLFHKPFPSTH
jgi:SAM-dependent methyltransferase